MGDPHDPRTTQVVLGVKPLLRPGNLPARTRQLTPQACRKAETRVRLHLAEAVHVLPALSSGPNQSAPSTSYPGEPAVNEASR